MNMMEVGLVAAMKLGALAMTLGVLLVMTVVVWICRLRSGERREGRGSSARRSPYQSKKDKKTKKRV